MRLAAVALAAAFSLSMTSSLWANDVAEIVVWHSLGVVAVIVTWIGVGLRRRLRDRGQAGWMSVGIGLTAWVVGDIAWDVLSWNEELPDVSVVDVAYVFGYVALIVGVALLSRVATGRLPFDAVLDGLTFCAAAGLVIWIGLIEPAADPTASWLYRVVTATYPIAALVLVGSLGWMWFHPRRSQVSTGAGILAIALSGFPLLEFASAWYYLYEPDIELEPILDRLFLVAFAGIALATHAGADGRRRPDPNQQHPIRLVVLGAALFVGPATLAVEGSRGAAVVASAVISALVLARFAWLTREREAARAELAYRATHDDLTGLANRGMLMEALQLAARPRDGIEGGMAVVCIDVDDFKLVNDTHGHAAGDALLVELSERIGDAIRPSDVAARLGGDEFVILCVGSGARADAEAVARRLHALIAEPFDLGRGTQAEITVSIGIAAEAGAIDVSELLRAADDALYEVKRTGRGALEIAGERPEGAAIRD